MHQVSSPADLDIAFDRRGSKSVEKPSGVLVANESIPLAANDRDGRLHQCRIIGELAVPGVQNVGTALSEFSLRPVLDFDSLGRCRGNARPIRQSEDAQALAVHPVERLRQNAPIDLRP